MALPIFNFPVDANNAARTNTHRTKSVQYGDGYKQLSPAGINNKLDTWDLTLPLLTDTVVAQVEAFCDAVGQHKNFNWTPPRGTLGIYRITSPIKYQAQGLDRSGTTRTTVVLSIEQVYLSTQLQIISIASSSQTEWVVNRDSTIGLISINYTLTITPVNGSATSINGSLFIANESSSGVISISAINTSSTQTLTILSGSRYTVGNPNVSSISINVIPSDPLFANVGLLLHFNNSFVDSSNLALAVSPIGAVISTAQSKWGGSSCSFYQSEIILPDNSALSRGIGDFCWEMWLYPDPGYFGQVTQNILIAPDGISKDGLTIKADGRLSWWYGSGELIPNPNATTQVTVSAWNYVSISRLSGVTTIRLNGSSYAKFANAQNYDFSSWRIGRGNYNYDFWGFIDDVRFTNTNRTINGIPTEEFLNN
jgi:phage-related protein